MNKNKKDMAEDGVEMGRHLLDEVRQMSFPEEFRIPVPDELLSALRKIPSDEQENGDAETESEAPGEPVSEAVVRAAVEMGIFCWYLKTRYFKVPWAETNPDLAEPRDRRVMLRLGKALDALTKAGFEIRDPTNDRFPVGGEGTMRPVEFFPTDDVQIDTVSETLSPIVFWRDTLVKRGEVFVSVPKVLDHSEDPEKK